MCYVFFAHCCDAEYHNAWCHHAENDNADCHFADCCRADCRHADCHQADCYHAECCHAMLSVIRLRFMATYWLNKHVQHQKCTDINTDRQVLRQIRK